MTNTLRHSVNEISPPVVSRQNEGYAGFGGGMPPSFIQVQSNATLWAQHHNTNAPTTTPNYAPPTS